MTSVFSTSFWRLIKFAACLVSALVMLLTIPGPQIMAEESCDASVPESGYSNDSDLAKGVNCWKGWLLVPSVDALVQKLETMQKNSSPDLKGTVLGEQFLLKIYGYPIEITGEADFATLYYYSLSVIDKEKVVLALDPNSEAVSQAENNIAVSVATVSLIAGDYASQGQDPSKYISQDFLKDQAIIKGAVAAKQDHVKYHQAFLNAFPEINKIRNNAETRKQFFEHELKAGNEDWNKFVANVWAKEYGAEMVPSEYRDLILNPDSKPARWFVPLSSGALLLLITPFAGLALRKKIKAGGYSKLQEKTSILLLSFPIILFVVLGVSSFDLFQNNREIQDTKSKNEEYRQNLRDNRAEQVKNLFAEYQQYRAKELAEMNRKTEEILKNSAESVKKAQEAINNPDLLVSR